MKEILMVLLKKFCLGQIDHFGHKKTHTHDSESALTFLKFCTIKGTNWYMKVMLMAFT